MLKQIPNILSTFEANFTDFTVSLGDNLNLEVRQADEEQTLALVFAQMGGYTIVHTENGRVGSVEKEGNNFVYYQIPNRGRITLEGMNVVEIAVEVSKLHFETTQN